ncbi:MAG: hypothetical protein ACK559_28410 [bacterium]
MKGTSLGRGPSMRDSEKRTVVSSLPDATPIPPGRCTCPRDANVAPG